MRGAPTPPRPRCRAPTQGSVPGQPPAKMSSEERATIEALDLSTPDPNKGLSWLPSTHANKAVPHAPEQGPTGQLDPPPGWPDLATRLPDLWRRRRKNSGAEGESQGVGKIGRGLMPPTRGVATSQCMHHRPRDRPDMTLKPPEPHRVQRGEDEEREPRHRPQEPSRLARLLSLAMARSGEELRGGGSGYSRSPPESPLGSDVGAVDRLLLIRPFKTQDRNQNAQSVVLRRDY